MPLSYGLVPHLSKKLSKFTYLQQLCRVIGFNLGDLPEAMDSRDEWQERERERETETERERERERESQ